MTHHPIPRHIISHNGLCFTLYLVHKVLAHSGLCYRDCGIDNVVITIHVWVSVLFFT